MVASSVCFVAFGLLLDIFGATLIAVPDVPWLSELLGAGSLKRAREQMEAEGVTEDDVGFSDLETILNGIPPVSDIGTQNGGENYAEIIVNSKTGYPGQVNFTWGEEYVEARYAQDADYDDMDYYPVGEVYRIIRSRVRKQATRIRLSGLFLLASGFSLQLLGTLTQSATA
ncbi:hypothetical protein [Halorussus ruber]|uniref:hypothetical protein n=1 Tax=Halorussus ruber TaxID=1126238 RepID=UPI001092DCA9|nr:hypothetical protein [Halorussus ruber]